MLVILLPEQVLKHWDELRLYIEAALPVHMQKGYDMNKVLEFVVVGQLMVALLVNKEGTIIGVFSFRVQTDRMLGVKTLVLVTGFSDRILTPDDMDKVFETLKPLAREQGCSNILFYTDKEDAVKLMKASGGSEHKFLMWEV